MTAMTSLDQEAAPGPRLRPWPTSSVASNIVQGAAGPSGLEGVELGMRIQDSRQRRQGITKDHSPSDLHG